LRIIVGNTPNFVAPERRGKKGKTYGEKSRLILQISPFSRPLRKWGEREEKWGGKKRMPGISKF